MEVFVWLLVSALIIIPMLKFLPFFGINKWWALASIVPIGTIALLWWMGIKLQELERR